MESEAVMRRLSMLAAHFAPNDDCISATHLLPLNCSSSLNSVIRRCDNKLYFARQASGQTSFTRQASTEQFFQSTEPQYGMPVKCSDNALDNYHNACEAPLFSRPVKVETNVSSIAAVQPLGQDCVLPFPDLPAFARPTDLPTFSRPTSKTNRERQLCPNEKIKSSESSVTEWSPRMDVAESGCSYVMTVEIPGVSIGDIRVEVDNQNLYVSGRRYTQCWTAAGCTHSISAYHMREIMQGPYQVVWPLPANVRKDHISAEFLDGFLRIIAPKL